MKEQSDSNQHTTISEMSLFNVHTSEQTTTIYSVCVWIIGGLNFSG